MQLIHLVSVNPFACICPLERFVYFSTMEIALRCRAGDVVIGSGFVVTNISFVFVENSLSVWYINRERE